LKVDVILSVTTRSLNLFKSALEELVNIIDDIEAEDDVQYFSEEDTLELYDNCIYLMEEFKVPYCYEVGCKVRYKGEEKVIQTYRIVDDDYIMVYFTDNTNNESTSYRCMEPIGS
jgi:hypothetical protein